MRVDSEVINLALAVFETHSGDVSGGTTGGDSVYCAVRQIVVPAAILDNFVCWLFANDECEDTDDAGAGGRT